MNNIYGELGVLRGQNRILQAENEKLKANQDYIAMMSDIELPEERGGEIESEI